MVNLSSPLVLFSSLLLYIVTSLLPVLLRSNLPSFVQPAFSLGGLSWQQQS